MWPWPGFVKRRHTVRRQQGHKMFQTQASISFGIMSDTVTVRERHCHCPRKAVEGWWVAVTNRTEVDVIKIECGWLQKYFQKTQNHHVPIEYPEGNTQGHVSEIDSTWMEIKARSNVLSIEGVCLLLTTMHTMGAKSAAFCQGDCTYYITWMVRQSLSFTGSWLWCSKCPTANMQCHFTF